MKEQLTNNYCEDRIRKAKQSVQYTLLARIGAFWDQDQISGVIFDRVTTTRLVRCLGLDLFSGNSQQLLQMPREVTQPKVTYF
jgi:hypothetical protein